MKIFMPGFLLASCCLAGGLHIKAEEPLLNMQELLDAGTLQAKVVQDWNRVKSSVPTRQKLITIRVGELLPGKEYRVPVRMIVPMDRKAKGFHLTGGHQQSRIERDAHPRGVEKDLLEGGVGLVYTMVQVLGQSGQGELGDAARRKFAETLNPRYSIQYWGWPAALVRATTAACAEKDHFEPGKVALSGSSKNGASPSVAIIHDKRMTAVHAGVSPIWDSPLRLCDRKAWDELRKFNESYVAKLKKKDPGLRTSRLLRHAFLGGTYGPVYNNEALAAGNKWKDLEALAARIADQVFISRNLDALKTRKVDLFFQPGTHDFVAFDIAWGGKHHPDIPLYLRANSGHGIREKHPAREKDEGNKTAFLLNHFFGGKDSFLEPPTVSASIKGKHLSVTVTFKPDSRAESGRIWWMFDRGPDGSAAYIRETFPDEQWKDMKSDSDKNAWTAEIDLALGASRIDFFSNHRKTIRHGSEKHSSYLSSPYTRVSLKAE